MDGGQTDEKTNRQEWTNGRTVARSLAWPTSCRDGGNEFTASCLLSHSTCYFPVAWDDDSFQNSPMSSSEYNRTSTFRESETFHFRSRSTQLNFQFYFFPRALLQKSLRLLVGRSSFVQFILFGKRRIAAKQGTIECMADARKRRR